MEEWHICRYSIRFILIAIFDVVFMSFGSQVLEEEEDRENAEGGEIFGGGVNGARAEEGEGVDREGKDVKF